MEVAVAVTVVLFAVLNVRDIPNNQVAAVLDLHAQPNVAQGVKDIPNNQPATVLVLHALLNVLLIVATDVVAVAKPIVQVVVE